MDVIHGPHAGWTRRGFLGAAAAFLVGCAGATRRSAAEPVRPVTTEPLVRVGLAVERLEARFRPVAGRYLLHESLADEAIAVAAEGETWRVVQRAPGELRVADPRGWLSMPHGRPVRVDPLDGAGILEVGERRYAGSLEVAPGVAGVTLVNEVPLEDYLRGVLGAEMPAGPGSLEALKAQAVAARTYALRRLGSRAELGFDLFADVQDQVYNGLDGTAETADRAVRETRGAVLLSEGLLLDAYYHSTCGGVTAAVEEAFSQPPVPYLVSVDDGDGKGGFHCSSSRYFRWRASFDARRLEAVLARNLPRFAALPSSGLGSVEDIDIAESSEGGRVLALRIETTTGNFQVARNDVRWLFADQSSPGLRSTLFLLRKQRRRGAVEVTMTGGGWGHGVGLCQVGAIGRSASGARHAEILARYYQESRLERLYA